MSYPLPSIVGPPHLIYENPEDNWTTPDAEVIRLSASKVIAITQNILSALGPVLSPSNHKLIAEYSLDLPMWYTSLKSIQRLPELIPPVSDHMLANMAEPCPTELCSQKKPDGTFYTVGEKCILLLVSQELGTIEEFTTTVESYGNEVYRPEEHPSWKMQPVWKDNVASYGLRHPLHSRFCDKTVLNEYGDIPPEPTHWVLRAGEVLESDLTEMRGEGRVDPPNKPFTEQAELVASLKDKTGVDWQIPSLRDAITTIYLERIHTKPKPYDGNPGRFIFTWVKEGIKEKEEIGDKRIMVGGPPSFGLRIMIDWACQGGTKSVRVQCCV
jgi:hypothetical protein